VNDKERGKTKDWTKNANNYEYLLNRTLK